jgi:TrmH family RNA methyltransferase
MISKNQIKHIQSLHKARGRKKARQFIVEGPKAVGELLKSDFKVNEVFATEAWCAENTHLFPAVEQISPRELERISNQKQPNQVLAVVEMPEVNAAPARIEGLYLVLDTIQDPGNLGTIIRIADWFGINEVICSPDTADLFNPKVVQSTMGSISRVRVSYTALPDWLEQVAGQVPVYGTLLSGDNIYNTDLSPKGLIIIGNESKGISADVAFYVSQSIKIPSYGASETESLNAAVATGIVVAEFRRRI